MIKKLVVPALMLAMTAFGCSSSTTSTTGTGGSGGGAAAGHGGGTGGTAGGGGHAGSGGTAGGGGEAGAAGGHAGGGGAAGGHAGGAGGAAGGAAGSAGGHAGGGGGAGGAAGGAAGSAGGAGGHIMAATCTVTDSNGTNALSAAAFCTNLIANCPNLPADYADTTTCMATYTASATVNGRQHCQSYHLCWGVEGLPNGTPNPTTHCPHAEGMGPCAPDAGF
jgi:hypothetical protein